MRTTTRMTAIGASALAFALLSVSPSLAASHSSKSSHRDHFASGSRQTQSHRQAAPRAVERSNRSPRAAGAGRLERGDPRASAADRQRRAHSNPSDASRWRSDSRDRSSWGSGPRYDARQDGPRRSTSRYDRQRDTRWDSGSRYYGRGDGRWNSGSRYDGRRDWGRHDGYRRQRFAGHVQRLVRVDGGYRFWLDNCREPFWIPEARFVLWPLRVGLSVQFGGYWNSAGYYGVEEYGPPAVVVPAADLLAGIFVAYDYGRGTLTVRDDRTDAYVSVVLLGNDLDPAILRAGDWISLSGNWNRGDFEAYRVEDLRVR